MKKQMMKTILAAVCMVLMFWVLPAAVQAAEIVDGHAVAPAVAAMAATTKVNVRSGPGTSCQKIGILEAGEAVNVCGISDNGWYQVVYETQIGYMSSQYLIQIPVDDTMLAALADQAVFIKQLAMRGAGKGNQSAQKAAAACALDMMDKEDTH